MVQGNHARKYRGRWSSPATMDTSGAHNHLRTLSQQTPEVTQSHRNLHQQHQQNVILRGPNVCQKSFYQWRDDGVQDDPNQWEERLDQDTRLINHPIRPAKSVLREPSSRNQIQECSQWHPYIPGNECRKCLHQPKQRQHNEDTRGRGDGGLSRLRQRTVRISGRCKRIRSKHKIHTKRPNNNQTMGQTSSATEADIFCALTDNKTTKSEIQKGGAPPKNPTKRGKHENNIFPNFRKIVYHKANNCFK